MRWLTILVSLVTILACDYNQDDINGPYALDVNLDNKFPITSVKTLEWIQDEHCYQGAYFFAGPTKSSFFIEKGSLTAPEDHLVKSPVKITYTMDKKGNKELIYTFGPAGCTFDPPAIVTMDFTEIKSTNNSCTEQPKLYYICDDSTLVEQAADQINLQERWLKVKISHFSRYAIAYGN